MVIQGQGVHGIRPIFCGQISAVTESLPAAAWPNGPGNHHRPGGFQAISVKNVELGLIVRYKEVTVFHQEIVDLPFDLFFYEGILGLLVLDDKQGGSWGL